MITYCGVPAVPADFWIRWNGDPLLLAALAALAFAVGRGYSSNARAGWGAIALMVVIFVSPLCALASALFSADLKRYATMPFYSRRHWCLSGLATLFLLSSLKNKHENRG